MNNLVIDIGNNRIKVGVFNQANLIAREVFDHGADEKFMIWLTNQSVENVILSTVGKSLSPELEQFLRSNRNFIRLSHTTPLPIRNQYKTPETLGKDRIAAVVGAFALYPDQHCVVIDAGTCITMEVLRKDGTYLGGNIAPGLQMRLKAMHAFTERLPEVMLTDEITTIGYSTESAMQNGAQWGATLEAEGFVDQMAAKLGAVNVILTGGDADFFAKKMKRKIFVHHNLVLSGLNKILSYNVENLE